MRIGLTYDLRREYLAEGFSEEDAAEFDSDETVDGIEAALRELGHEPDRVGRAKRLTERLVRGDRWDLVFNIAEGSNGIGREAQVPALLDLYEIPYTFSDPLVMSLTLHKGLTKRVIRDAGVPTADFLVAERPSDARRVSFEPPYFVKPVAEGTGKGINAASLVERREDLEPVCKRLIETFRQAALVEEFLSGREFTVGVAGEGDEAAALGAMEVVLLKGAETGGYGFFNKKHFEDVVRYRPAKAQEDPLAAEAADVSVAAWRALGCRDAGRVDVRCNRQGRVQFIEVNPLAGLNPVISDLPILCRMNGISYVDLIGRIVASASRRVRR